MSVAVELEYGLAEINAEPQSRGQITRPEEEEVDLFDALWFLRNPDAVRSRRIDLKALEQWVVNYMLFRVAENTVVTAGNGQCVYLDRTAEKPTLVWLPLSHAGDHKSSLRFKVHSVQDNPSADLAEIDEIA